MRGVADGRGVVLLPGDAEGPGRGFWRVVVNDDPLPPTLPAAREIRGASAGGHCRPCRRPGLNRCPEGPAGAPEPWTT